MICCGSTMAESMRLPPSYSNVRDAARPSQRSTRSPPSAEAHGDLHTAPASNGSIGASLVPVNMASP